MSDQAILITTRGNDVHVSLHRNADHATKAAERREYDHGWVATKASDFDEIEDLQVLVRVYNKFADEAIAGFEDHATANGRVWSLLFEKLTEEKLEAPAREPKADQPAKKADPKPAAKAEKKAAEKPAKKAAAAPKAPKAKAGNGAGQMTRLFPMDAKIKLLVKGNPKREGGKSAKRFSAYKDGMTVQEALKAGLKAADLKYDESKKFIAVQGGTRK
jgi:hypothetical protein